MSDTTNIFMEKIKIIKMVFLIGKYSSLSQCQEKVQVGTDRRLRSDYTSMQSDLSLRWHSMGSQGSTVSPGLRLI